jgi:hypothetical protein
MFKGGEGKAAMEEAGISVYAHSPDNYGDKGAGFFMLWLSGMEVEMLGRRGTLTLLDKNVMFYLLIFLLGIISLFLAQREGSYASSCCSFRSNKQTNKQMLQSLKGTSKTEYNINSVTLLQLIFSPSLPGCY